MKRDAHVIKSNIKTFLSLWRGVAKKKNQGERQLSNLFYMSGLNYE